MKTQRPARPPRSPARPKAPVTPNGEQAVRLCEEAAARIRSASEELAAGWIALGLEISLQGTANDLLRKRAWCNLLELRLKERTHALKEARQSVDAVWPELMMAARGREMFKRYQGKCAEENLFHKSWSLLLQAKSAPAPRPRATDGAK